MPRKPSHGLAGVGRADQALGTIDEALSKSERGEERWCIAELLRIKADLVLLVGDPGSAHTAEELLEQTLHWTRRQDVLSLELRVAMNLARLWHQQGRAEPARELLASVYGRFTEASINGTRMHRAARSREFQSPPRVVSHRNGFVPARNVARFPILSRFGGMALA
jgi:predicted ATPase